MLLELVSWRVDAASGFCAEPLHRNSPRKGQPRTARFEMDVSDSQDSLAVDNTYNPQIINETDHAMTGTAEPLTNGYNNGYSNGQNNSHYVSPSADYPSSSQPLSPPADGDPGSRYNSPTLAYQHQPTSRPGSGLSGQQGYHGQHQDQNRQAAAPSKSSVVIKVGMVGDAQIGKTSLMVKYVEGSWDEDYIQTLGTTVFPFRIVPGICG